ncbi:hypothetical protein ACFZBU_43345 [Embleya sp. NPDC008237]|uniref:hypothetical protein n=1 Tax=Embleya sp. NPDC008237 TaxID=3363978 RepID=UPI0036E26707
MSTTLPSPAGRIVDVGVAAGRVAAMDPAGRFVALEDRGRLTVHDSHRGLTAVMSCPYRVPGEALAVGPDGTGLAVLRADLTIEVHGPDGQARRSALPVATGRPIRPSLRFTADGACLALVWNTGQEAGGRLLLLDAATLEPMDNAALETRVTAQPAVVDEGVEIAIGPGASTTIALAACSGDDTALLAVAETADGVLRWHGLDTDPAALAEGVPGERVMAIALSDTADLVVLDSDGFVSTVPWRTPGMSARIVAHSGEPLPDDDTWACNGPIFTRGRLLAAVVEHEYPAGGRYEWEATGLAVLDLRTGRWRGLLELPPPQRGERTVVEGGLICRSAGGRTHIARWVSPADTASG